MSVSMRLAVLLAGILCACAGVRAEDVKATVKKEKPKIEVVFVLDTTSSMSGLIQAAKEKIWAIANTLATTKPAPDIKMGLLAYRDKGDAYITKMTPLTDDLDAIFKELMGYKAEGGGDEPESVNQALNEAVTQFAWNADKKVYKVIFLVGDSPPHMDYTDDVKYPETCKLAAGKGLTINSIQCGTTASTTPIWQDIAAKAEGSFFRVEQGGGAVLASTPFDGDLAKLAGELDSTRIVYGAAEMDHESARGKVADAIKADASVEAQARRAIFNSSEAGGANWAGRRELVRDLTDGKAKLADLKEEELPENLRKIPAADREKFIAENQAKRAEIKKQITELAQKRRAFLDEEVKKQAAAGKANLMTEMKKAIRGQAAKKDIEYDARPAEE